MKAAKKEGASGKQSERRRCIIIRLSRKLKLIVSWRPRRRLSGLLASLLAGLSAQAMAAPQGGSVVSGNASISNPSSGVTVIKQDSARAAIDWRSYSVASGERVTYQQPTSTSVTLNRVTGGDLSSIYGSINANGVVVISNPAGVYFGQGAQVNVGGLVAGAMAIGNADFNAGDYRFTGNGSGSVKNEGSIQAGSFGVAMIGHTVDNSGRIESGGAVILGAGGQATLKLANDRLVDIAVDASALKSQVSNRGVIHADGNNIFLTARATDALLDTVLFAGGEMRADSLREVNGKIVLDGGSSGVVEVRGALQTRGMNPGEKGGDITVQGERILLAQASQIDASGDAGGGRVRVGGGYQGQDPNIAHAYDVVMQPGASISADATVKGDGGEVVLWSDHGTVFAGSISAKGGAEGGDGGRVETSGRYLQAHGSVRASAAKGKAGSWLLDPYDIIIGNQPSQGISTTNNSSMTAVSDFAYVNAGDISSALSAGTSVTVSTGTGGTQPGNISLIAGISSSANTATTLDLQAAGDIYLIPTGSIVGNNGALNVGLHAGGGVLMMPGASIDTKGGTLNVVGTLVSLDGVQTKGGNVVVNASADATLTNVSTGNATSGWGRMDVQASSLSMAEVVAGRLNLIVTNGIGQTGKVTAMGSTTIDAGTSDVALENPSNVFTGPVGIQSAKNVALASEVELLIHGQTSGDLSLSAPGIKQAPAGSLAVQGSTTIDAGTNDVVLDNPFNVLTGAVGIQSAKNVTLANDGELVIHGQVSGDLNISAQGIRQGARPLSVQGGTTLEAGTGNDILLFDPLNAFTGTVQIQAANSVAIANDRELRIAGQISGNLNLSAPAIKQFNALNVAGTTVLAAGVEGTVLLTHTGNFFNGEITIESASDATIVNGVNTTLKGAVENNLFIQTEGLASFGPMVVKGNLTVRSNGIGQEGGALTVNGDTMLNAGIHNDITLDSAGNDLKGRVSVQTGRDVTIMSKNLQLDGEISRDLTARARNGSLTQNGALKVAGQSTLDAQDNIVLDNPANSFTGPVALTTDSGSASLKNSFTGETVFTANVGAVLDIQTVGALKQSEASINVGSGTTTLSAASIDISGTGNVFNGALNLNANSLNTGTVAVAGQVTGDLNVDAKGNISQGSNALNVGAATTLTAKGDAARTITLENGDNSFTGRVKLDNAGDSSIVSSGSLKLEGSTGKLTAKAVGSITQDNAITATGGLDLKVTGLDHDIILGHSDNNWTGTAKFDATRDVTLRSADLQLEGTAGGNLEAQARSRSLTQSGALDVTGKSTLEASDTITLQNPANRFAGAVDLKTTSGEARLVNAYTGSMALTADVASNLDVQTGGALVQGVGILKTANGATNITAASIDISGAGNVFNGALDLAAKDAASGTVAVAGQITGKLTVDAKGDISQGSNALNVTGETALKAQGDAPRSITLENLANSFTDRVNLDNAGDTSIVSAGNLKVEGSTGKLTARSTGSISQLGGLSASGLDLKVTGPDQDIVLLSSLNNWTGPVKFAATRDVKLFNLGELKVEGEAKRELSLESAQAITQTGALKTDSTSGSTTLKAGGDITVAGDGNVFGAILDFNGTGEVRIKSAGDLKLKGSAGNLLEVTADGSITQGDGGSLTSTGIATFTANGAGKKITLLGDGNDFAGVATLTANGDIAVAGQFGDNLTVRSGGEVGLTADVGGNLDVESSFLTQGAGRVKVDGTTRLVATGINLRGAGNDFGKSVEIDSALSTTFGGHVAGDLRIEAGSNIGQENPLTVDGKTTLVMNGAAHRSISFENAGNLFAKTVNFSSIGDVRIKSGGSLQLEGNAGNLIVSAGGGISQGSNPLSVGYATFTTTGVNQDITLTHENNVFHGDVDLKSSGKAEIKNSVDLYLSGEVKGNLAATALDASILQASGPVIVHGDATFTTTRAPNSLNATDILLPRTDNVFDGKLTLNSAGRALVNGRGNLQIGGTVSQGLEVTASGGSIQQGSTLHVGGSSTLKTEAGSNGQATDITLADINNTFGGTVSLDSAGKVDIAATGNLQLDGKVADTLAATAYGGSITQGGGPLTVQSTSTLETVNTGNNQPTDVSLANPSNSFGGAVMLDSAGDATLAGAGNLVIGGAVDGKLAVQATGDISQSGSLIVGGTSQLEASGKIDLGNTSNDFKNLVTVVSATDVTIADRNDLKTEGQASGNLVLQANGELSQGGAWQAGGTTTLDAGSGSVVFTNPGNQFTGTVGVIAGQDASVSASNPVTVTANVGGNVQLTAPQVTVVDGSIGGNLNVVGEAFLSPVLVVSGSNGPVLLKNAVQRTLASIMSTLNESGPNSLSKYLRLANPPVRAQGSLLPAVEGSGILLPTSEKEGQLTQ